MPAIRGTGSTANDRPTWRVIGRSVRGANHIRSGQVNQDAIGWVPETGEGLPVMLVLADGHGSDKCFRSYKGSEFAVSVACKTLKEFSENQVKSNDDQLKLSEDQRKSQALSYVKDMAIRWLPQEISKRWRDEVRKHLKQSPISDVELKTLTEVAGTTSVQEFNNNPWLAYGTTLLAVLVTDFYTLFLQLGDGDILTVAYDGKVLSPLPTDDRLLANETTSLSAEQAWRDFRSVLRVYEDKPPALIIASTDGCSNSFRSTDDFLKVGSDLWDRICLDGIESLESDLDNWLTSLSQLGSGDDISLGILCRKAAIDQKAKTLALSRKNATRRDVDSSGADVTPTTSTESSVKWTWSAYIALLLAVVVSAGILLFSSQRFDLLPNPENVASPVAKPVQANHPQKTAASVTLTRKNPVSLSEDQQAVATMNETGVQKRTTESEETRKRVKSRRTDVTTHTAEALALEEKSPNDALERYRQILSENPRSRDALEGCRRICFSQKWYEEAEDCFLEAIEQNLTSHDKTLLHDLYLYLGDSHYERRQFVEAVAAYSNAIATNKNAVALHRRAVVYEFTKEYKLAIKDCDDAIKLKAIAYQKSGPGNGKSNSKSLITDNALLHDLYLIRGNSRCALAFFSQAIEDYNEALKKHRSAIALYGRALASKSQGKNEDARKDCLAAIELLQKTHDVVGLNRADLERLLESLEPKRQRSQNSSRQ